MCHGLPCTPKQLEKRRIRLASRLRRRSEWWGQPCDSDFAADGDKTYEDCEEWCDQSKIGHCRFCKCRGCKHCHGDLSLPDWATDAANASTKPLCLSVWRGEVYEGAPLVWARCRRDVTTHQRWAAEGGGGAGSAFSLRHDPEGAPAGAPLCVAVPAPADLVAWAAENTLLPL